MDHDPLTDVRRRERFLAALLGTLFVGGGLLFLVLVTGGFFLWVLLAVGALGLMAGAHYLAWGKSLTEQTGAGQRAEEDFTLQSGEIPWEDPYEQRRL